MLNRALKFSSGAGRLAARSPRLASSSPAAARAMSTWSDTKNLSMQVEDDGIAVFTLDMEGEPVNTLSSSLMGDFEAMLNAVESDPKIKAAIIVSGKKSGWMAGADIKELAACKTAAEAENLSKWVLVLLFFDLRLRGWPGTWLCSLALLCPSSSFGGGVCGCGCVVLGGAGRRLALRIRHASPRTPTPPRHRAAATPSRCAPSHPNPSNLTHPTATHSHPPIPTPSSPPLYRMGQAALAKLSASKKPFVAAIDGPALGGGLEFALACHHRICTSSKGTQLGLVEMGIGLLPGGGGTQRMPALVGIQESLKAMTTAARLRPDKAKKIGLVSTVADPNALMEAARVAARGLADGSIKPNVAKKKNMMNKVGYGVWGVR